MTALRVYQDEILPAGMDAWALAEAARKRRQAAYRTPKPIAELPAGLKVVSGTQQPSNTILDLVDKSNNYVFPIQGPCRPDHPLFKFYNGEWDIIILARDGNEPVLLSSIKAWVNRNLEHSWLEIISHRRQKPLVIDRQKTAWIIHRYTARSYPEAGRILGKRDHTTIMHSVKQIEKLIASGKWEPPSREQILAAGQ